MEAVVDATAAVTAVARDFYQKFNVILYHVRFVQSVCMFVK